MIIVSGTEITENESLDNIDESISRIKALMQMGVENQQQAELLVETGCTMLQGYYFSKPVDTDTFEKLLQNGLLLS